MTTAALDTKGLHCPIPIVKTKQALRKLAVGDRLEVLATDPGAVHDFEAFSRSTGNELLEWGCLTSAPLGHIEVFS